MISRVLTLPIGECGWEVRIWLHDGERCYELLYPDGCKHCPAPVTIEEAVEVAMPAASHREQLHEVAILAGIMAGWTSRPVKQISPRLRHEQTTKRQTNKDNGIPTR